MSSENKLYFSHDFYSRDNLSNLRMKCGLEGYGIYWCLVEIMHENGGEIKESDIDGIAYNLHTDASKILEVIENCDTFSSKKGVITSKRVLDNIKKREKISAIRREAVGQRKRTARSKNRRGRGKSYRRRTAAGSRFLCKQFR